MRPNGMNHIQDAVHGDYRVAVCRKGHGRRNPFLSYSDHFFDLCVVRQPDPGQPVQAKKANYDQRKGDAPNNNHTHIGNAIASSIIATTDFSPHLNARIYSDARESSNSLIDP